MSVYLETNTLRKLTNYDWEESVCISIFAIYELLAGITEKDFEIRKACLTTYREAKNWNKVSHNWYIINWFK